MSQRHELALLNSLSMFTFCEVKAVERSNLRAQALVIDLVLIPAP